MFLKGPWDHKDILACGQDHVSSAQMMGKAPWWIPEASPGKLPPLLDTVLGSHPSSHSQSYGFSSSQVQMWELDHKESWAPKNWWTVVLEKTLESPLDCKEIKPVNPKGNQSCIFIRRTDAEAEAPILRPPDVKSRLIRKDPDAGKDWGQKKKGVTEIGWHHWLNWREFEQIPGDGEGQESLACCSPWGHKKSDTVERLKNNTKFSSWGASCLIWKIQVKLMPNPYFWKKKKKTKQNTELASLFLSNYSLFK